MFEGRINLTGILVAGGRYTVLRDFPSRRLLELSSVQPDGQNLFRFGALFGTPCRRVGIVWRPTGLGFLCIGHR